MKLFALSDPHLSFGVPGKSMDRFGPEWVRHPDKIKANWEKVVGPDDVVAVTGDISWAKKFEAAQHDLNWIGELPGRKVILRGNHDIWWPSSTVLERELHPSISFIQNNHVKIGPFVFFGSRMWDTAEYSVFDLIEWDPKKGAIPGVKSGGDLKEQERIVLSLYYFEELKLHEIAKVLELTESRVSQIRSKALSKLRVELRPLREDVA